MPTFVEYELFHNMNEKKLVGDIVELTQVSLFDMVLQPILAVDRVLIFSWYS